jgi:hypothetical protein
MSEDRLQKVGQAGRVATGGALLAILATVIQLGPIAGVGALGAAIFFGGLTICVMRALEPQPTGAAGATA